MTTPTPYAKVIAHSITEDGHELVTVEAGCWRPVLAEQNTHRVLSRNSASSRAIPIEKNLARFKDEFMYPAEWGAERPGMQQGEPLTGTPLDKAMALWDDLAYTTSNLIESYLDDNPLEDGPRLHKGLLNRWLEVGLQQVQIITGTQWDGYFWQRCHEHADKNIRLMAEEIRTAVSESIPHELARGFWHLPYFGHMGSGFSDDWDLVMEMADDQEELAVSYAKQISAGRCARVSHMNQAGKRDIQNDLTLYERLADRSDDPANPPHASPLEHVATPWPENVQHVTMPNGKTMGPLPRLGNFVGYLQMRHDELAF